MTFADLVEEIRQLPTESLETLQLIIKQEHRERFENEVLEGHKEAMEEYKAGKLEFTSDPDELIRRLVADD